MARQVFHHTFRVSGKRQFPVDMLRRDACYPRNTESAVEMYRDHRDEDYNEARTIEMASDQERRWNPTIGRWLSFGWDVRDHDRGHAINS